MAPSDYIEARLKGDEADQLYKVTVDDFPYYPYLKVDPTDEMSVGRVASLILGASNENLTVAKISGGITNQLFRVSGLVEGQNSVLVRVFGAEGMIDRNIENATYAALARRQLAPKYFGRFANGRIEEWLEARPLEVKELSKYSLQIAKQLAHLHASFQVPPTLSEFHSKPALWTQIHDWMNQALTASFNKSEDTRRAKALDLSQIQSELHWLEQHVIPSDCQIAFCHNDILAANILLLHDKNTIQLIDFEYGGINYVAFDIANHFNEWAGGTDDGVPNYNLFPSRLQQVDFIKAYLEECSSEVNAHDMLQVVQKFVMVDHLYWALWGVNQGSAEGCDDFDYLLFASNRLRQYYKCKAECE